MAAAAAAAAATAAELNPLDRTVEPALVGDMQFTGADVTPGPGPPPEVDITQLNILSGAERGWEETGDRQMMGEREGERGAREEQHEHLALSSRCLAHACDHSRSHWLQRRRREADSRLAFPS